MRRVGGNQKLWRPEDVQENANDKSKGANFKVRYMPSQYLGDDCIL
jgi:hypothetical protein